MVHNFKKFVIENLSSDETAELRAMGLGGISPDKIDAVADTYDNKHQLEDDEEYEED